MHCKLAAAVLPTQYTIWASATLLWAASMLTLTPDLMAFVYAMPPQRAHCLLCWSCVTRVNFSTPAARPGEGAAGGGAAAGRRRPRSDNGRLQQPAGVGSAHTVLQLGRDRR